MNLCDRETLRTLLGRHGFHFSKSMGQNFLIDPAVPADIASASQADESCGVVEIGPGVGCLTAELAERAGKVLSIELDKKLLPVLAETMAPFDNVEIIPGDALKLDLQALAAERFPGLRPLVCANLPYNITTPVLTKLVETPCFESITVLLQKEVARRLAAEQGSGGGGAFTLWLQYHMETEVLFDVPAVKFFPAPKVDSAVLRCVRRERPAVETEDETFFFRVVRGAFLLRRKTLVNSLAAALPEAGKERVQAAMETCGLPLTIRGEKLTLEDFARLAAVLAEERRSLS
ncbi:MAG: ribosomal RNA small subunit methyltransferase A [Oscillibacter sp.]|jgi:16S rRNA (adenine1518-N6/adenine1519-N6)-dimethyltransferase|nr:ribosomal RNA small subunit methyltransferase A [Oscillibacter sp.]